MGSSTACGPSMKSENDWQAEDDHRTMSRAAEISGDSKRMAGVRKHHRKVKKQISVVGRTIGGKR